MLPTKAVGRFIYIYELAGILGDVSVSSIEKEYVVCVLIVLSFNYILLI